MLLHVILEGLGLGALLILVCAAGIRKRAVGMVHLYSPAVQQRCVKLGLTSPERIRRNSLLFKAVCIPGYIGYVLACWAAKKPHSASRLRRARRKFHAARVKVCCIWIPPCVL